MPSSEPSLTALEAAVKANSVADVSRTLATYPDLKKILDAPMPGGPFGATPLLGAVSRKNREIIDVLLGAGANINARSDWWAGSFGVLDGLGPGDPLAAFLIERGATIDANAAARLDRLDRLQELVAADPKAVHARGGDGQTPLHVAATVRIAEFLLDHGADIDAIDVDHESTAAQYLLRDHAEVARYLVSRGCRTDILMAASLGDLDLTRRILDENPAAIHTSVSDKDFPKKNPHSGGTIYIWVLGWNKTPHALARDGGHDAVYRLLMERSTDTMKLAAAAEIGDEAAARALLAAKPGLLGELSDADRSRVAMAAQGNDAGAVRLMLDLGWPVDGRGADGVTPLHWASFHGNLDMVRTILAHRPPLELKDLEHQGTPLGWAIFGSKHGWYCRTGDYAGVVEALLQVGATLPSGPAGDIDASDAVRTVLRRHGSKS